MKANKLFSVIALLAIITIGFIACNNDNDTTSHTHEWGDWTVTTPATCTTAGEETRVCVLDATHKETRPIPALGHDWGDWVVTKAPTATEEGEETKTCKRDPSHTETQVVEKVSFIGTWNAYSGIALKDENEFIFTENEFTFKTKGTNLFKGTFTFLEIDIQISLTHRWQNNQWVVFTSLGVMKYTFQDNNTLEIVSFDDIKTDPIVGTYKRQQ
jgi:hypothetical protein